MKVPYTYILVIGVVLTMVGRLLIEDGLVFFIIAVGSLSLGACIPWLGKTMREQFDKIIEGFKK